MFVRPPRFGIPNPAVVRPSRAGWQVANCFHPSIPRGAGAADGDLGNSKKPRSTVGMGARPIAPAANILLVGGQQQFRLPICCNPRSNYWRRKSAGASFASVDELRPAIEFSGENIERYLFSQLPRATPASHSLPPTGDDGPARRAIRPTRRNVVAVRPGTTPLDQCSRRLFSAKPGCPGRRRVGTRHDRDPAGIYQSGTVTQSTNRRPREIPTVSFDADPK